MEFKLNMCWVLLYGGYIKWAVGLTNLKHHIEDTQAEIIENFRVYL